MGSLGWQTANRQRSKARPRPHVEPLPVRAFGEEERGVGIEQPCDQSARQPIGSIRRARMAKTSQPLPAEYPRRVHEDVRRVEAAVGDDASIVEAPQTIEALQRKEAGVRMTSPSERTVECR